MIKVKRHYFDNVLKHRTTPMGQSFGAVLGPAPTPNRPSTRLGAKFPTPGPTLGLWARAYPLKPLSDQFRLPPFGSHSGHGSVVADGHCNTWRSPCQKTC